MVRMIFVSDAERTQLKIQHRCERDDRIRDRINLSGVLDVINHEVLIQEDKRLNAQIRFFRNIEAAYPGKKKVHIFCHKAGYYRNKAVTEYLRTSKIKLHFLPPYSPNLNPIERFWKWMKERVYNTFRPVGA